MSTSTSDRPFVHLHVHSHFSLRDGVAPIGALVRQAAWLDMKSIALTDHNTMAGMVSFLEECESTGIHPIPGCQLDVAPWSETAERSVFGSIVLLVESEIGYQNLARLVSLANSKIRDGLPPHVTHEELGESSNGLIALVGLSSPLRHFIKPPDTARIEEYLTDMVRMFGKQSLFFELVPPASDRQRSLNEYFIQLGEFLGLQVVASNDVHYVWPEDELARLFKLGETPPRSIGKKAAELGEGRRHLSTAHEMRDWFAFVPQAVANSELIAERCQFRPVLRRRRHLIHDFARGLDAESYLWDLVFRRATESYGELDDSVKSRLNHEFDYVSRNGLTNYFLLLSEMAGYLEEQKIPCLIRRGPITSSLIAHTLGLTGVDPLKHQLGFEPLLEDEAVFPEVTVQVASRHLPRVLDHLERNYGAERIARIGRYQYWQKTQLLSELCRWVGLPKHKAEALIAADAIATRGRGKVRWEDLFHNGTQALSPHHPSALSFVYRRLDPLPRTLISQGNRLALSGEAIDGLVPLAFPSGQGPTTQLDAADCDAMGLPRLDLVASKSLDILDEAVMWVRRERNNKFNLSEINDNDGETFRLFSQGRTVGVPGFEGVVTRTRLLRERPTSLDKLIQLKMTSQGGRGQTPRVPKGTVIADCLLAYQCAYVKARYPVSFYSALLTHVCKNHQRLARVLREMNQEGVRLLPPDINLSTYNFNQVGERIRTGLIVITHMGEKAANEIAAVRRGGEFHSLLDFCRRTDPRKVHHRVIENLIKAGAMDCFGLTRSQMLALLDRAFGQTRAPAEQPSSAVQMEFDLPAISDGDLEREFEPPDLPDLTLTLRLQYELQAAGHPISADPLKPFEDLMAQCRIARAPVNIHPRMEGRDVYMGGVVLQIEQAGPADPEGPGAWVDFDGVLVAIPERLLASRDRDLRGSDPLMMGVTVTRREDECYVRAHTLSTLIRIHQEASQARRVVLDLEGKDKSTARILRQLCARFPGPTPIVCVHFQHPGKLALRRLEGCRVIACPPLLNQLRGILGAGGVRVLGFGEMAEEEKVEAKVQG